MSNLGRRAVQLATILVCVIGGFILGWSTGSGGLEDYYRPALGGAIAGLAVGIAVAAILSLALGRRRGAIDERQARQAK